MWGIAQQWLAKDNLHWCFAMLPTAPTASMLAKPQENATKLKDHIMAGKCVHTYITHKKLCLSRERI